MEEVDPQHDRSDRSSRPPQGAGARKAPGGQPSEPPQPQAAAKDVPLPCAEPVTSAAQQQAAIACPGACNQVQPFSVQADAEPQVLLNSPPAHHETAVQPEPDRDAVGAGAQVARAQLSIPASFAPANSFAEQSSTARTATALIEVAALSQPGSSPALAEPPTVPHEVMGIHMGEQAPAQTDGQHTAAVASAEYMPGSNDLASPSYGLHLGLTAKSHGEDVSMAAIEQQSSVKGLKLHSVLSTPEPASPRIAAFTSTGTQGETAVPAVEQPVAAVAREAGALGSSMVHSMSASAAHNDSCVGAEQTLGVPALSKDSSTVVSTNVPVLGEDLSRVVTPAAVAMSAGMLKCCEKHRLNFSQRQGWCRAVHALLMFTLLQTFEQILIITAHQPLYVMHRALNCTDLDSNSGMCAVDQDFFDEH